MQDWTAGACDDAVRSGARFELLAYTDDAYEIVGIVFTGLPIVSLHVGEGETLGDEYVPGWIDVSAAGHDAVHASMLVHLRGGGFPQKYPKESYRVELHEVTPGGRDSKLSIPLLDLEADTDFILVANTGDETRMKNHLCWQLWESWSATGYALCTLKSRMVEVFVDDEYVGLYQLLERVDAQEELEAMGFNPGTDAVFRAIREENIGKRPVSDVGDPIGVLFELRYAPEGTAAEDAFELLYTWVELNRTDDERMDNEAFRSAAREHIDVQAMMEYFLFMQAVSLGMDNVVNNLFVFAVQQRGVWRYYLAPWDMDMAFQKVNATSPDELNLWLACPVRMLELNSMGCRDILWDLWRAKRRTVLEDDALRKWIMGEEERINASGAYLRDSRKWTGEAKTLDLSALAEFAVEHMYTIHEYMSELWPQ